MSIKTEGVQVLVALRNLVAAQRNASHGDRPVPTGQDPAALGILQAEVQFTKEGNIVFVGADVLSSCPS